MKDFIRNPAADRNPLASHTIRESDRSLSLVCTLASLLSQLVFLRILLREEELHLHEGYKPTVVMSHKCYYYIIPQCLYKRQDLHLHGLVAYQPTPDGAMSIYRLSSRFERFHHSCSFFNLQHVKELFSVPVLETFPYCIKIYGLVSVSQYKFLWRRGESNPRLAQAV